MATAPSNIIYIMLDDADYFDVGFNDVLLSMPDAITPHMDALAAGGTTFSQFYSAGAVCTPTRISVLTGSSPLERGATYAWQMEKEIEQGTSSTSGLSDDVPQLGLSMKDHGFATGHFGKWHVGESRLEYRHEALGFDTYSMHDRLPETDGYSGPIFFETEEGARIEDTDYLDSVHTDELIDFITESAEQGERFFANLWPLTPHTPISIPRDFDNSETNFDLETERGQLLAMMYTMDQNIGRVVSTLEDQGILDETLIVLTSDNGGVRALRNDSAPWKLGKAYLYESGIHVPMVAHWPDAIGAGLVNQSVMTTTDLLPTFLDLLGSDPSDLYTEIDGRSKALAFTENETLEHRAMAWQVWGRQPFSEDPRADKSFALRYDDLKLLKPHGRNELTDPNAYEVYDLIADPTERLNLNVTPREPEFAERLALLLLEERLRVSRIELVPENVSEQQILPFDPRFDIGTKHLTLDFTIEIPQDVSETKTLFALEDTHTLELLEDRSLLWTINGARSEGPLVTTTLQSSALSPDTHRITLSILGSKADRPIIELYVNGTRVDEMDRETVAIRGLWSSDGSITIGDDGVSMSDIRYFNLHFYQDELTLLSEPLPTHLFGKSDADVLAGSSDAEAILGGRGDDTLSGAAGPDEIWGGHGDDVVNGGGGADQVLAANGNDFVEGRNGSDTIDGGNGNDTIDGGGGDDLLTGGDDDDVMNGNDGNDIAYGGRGDDTLLGGDGEDDLHGRAGDDILIGQEGRDSLTGGAGADHFRFETVEDSAPGLFDTILDFSASAGDKIDLSAIDADISTAGNQAFSYGGSEDAGPLTRSVGHYWFANENGATFLNANNDLEDDIDFRLRIVDGDVLAAAYGEADMIV